MGCNAQFLRMGAMLGVNEKLDTYLCWEVLSWLIR
jgi:hypothetical protein